MRLGIMATTFARPSLEATLDAIAACGVRSVQFDLACVGMPTLPAQIAPALCTRICDACAARGLTLEALSGTFNMIHPDPSERAAGLRRHPDNDTPGAWTDLVASMREAVRGAEAAGVTLAFEPEVANVVDAARKARRLLDEIGSPGLKVVMDGANIFHSGELPRSSQSCRRTAQKGRHDGSRHTMACLGVGAIPLTALPHPADHGHGQPRPARRRAVSRGGEEPRR